jgi:hypothetical protein
MKIILQDADKFILRFDKDEEVFAGLMQFMKDQQITACAFRGIGACSSMELGYFNQHMKEYRRKPFLEDMEIISLIGTAGVSGAETVVHAHGLFGRNDFSSVGGHVFKMTISATCELFVTKLEGSMKREMNTDLNLNLLV